MRIDFTDTCRTLMSRFYDVAAYVYSPEARKLFFIYKKMCLEFRLLFFT